MAGREETESVTKKKDPSMTSKKSLERLRQAGVPDGGNCLYCHNNNDDELKVGRLLKDRASGITIHHYCLLFASGLSQRGRGRQGIEGFLPDDIIQEFRRAKRLACRYCTNRGATIGCVVKRCPMTFHFHCGLANGSLSQFFGNFNSYCLEHRPHQETDLSCGSPSKIECPICFCDVPCETNLNVLKTPCCNSTWLHRECVQRQAISSGYFFRCPVCNNKKEFEVEMKMFGIYIPEQDASWEREDGAYQELLERHNECNADKCLCPDGRFFCKGKQWSIVLCDLCGSQGCHVKCGGLKNKSKDWACWICRTMVGSEVGPKSMKSTTFTKKQLNGRPYKMKLQGKPLRTPLPSNSLVKLFKDDDQPFSFSLSEGLPAARKAAGVHLPVVTMHPLTWQEIIEHGCSDQLLSINLLRKSSRSCRLEIPPMIYKELDEIINKRKSASDSDEPPLITRMHKRPCLSLSPETKDQHKPLKKIKLFQSKLFNVTEKNEVFEEPNIKTCLSTSSSLSDVFSQSEIFISSDEDNVDEDLLHKPVFPKDVKLERQVDEIRSFDHQKLSETSEEDTSDSVKVFLCEKHKRTTGDFIKSCKPIILNDVPVKLEHQKDKSISVSQQKLSEIFDRETYLNINSIDPFQSLCKKHKRTGDLVSSYNQTHNKTLPGEVEYPKDEGSFVGHHKQSKTSDDGISHDVNVPTSFCKKRQCDVDFDPVLLHNEKLEHQNDKVMSVYHAKVTEASIDVNSMKNSVFCEKHKKKTSDLISSDEKVIPKNMIRKNSKDDKSCVSYQQSYVESEIQTDDYNSPVRRNTLKSFYADVSTDLLSMLEDEGCSEYKITKREESTDPDDKNKKSLIRKGKKSKQMKRVKSQSNLVQPTLKNYFTTSESSSADELAPFEIRCSPRFKPPNRRVTRASQRKQNYTFTSTEYNKKKQKSSNGRRRRHKNKKKMEKTPTIDLHQYLIKCLPNSTFEKPSENDCTQVNLLNSQLLLSSSNRRLKEMKTRKIDGSVNRSRSKYAKIPTVKVNEEKLEESGKGGRGSLRKCKIESSLKKKRRENKKEITKVKGERPTENEKAQYSKYSTTIKEKRPPELKTTKYLKEQEENMEKSTKMKRKRTSEDKTANKEKEEKNMEKSTKLEEERLTEDEKEQHLKEKEENMGKSTKMKEKRSTEDETAKCLKEKKDMGKSTKMKGKRPTEDETAKYLKGKEENMRKSTKIEEERPTEDEKAQYSMKNETNMDEFTTIKEKRPPEVKTAKYFKNMEKSTKMKGKRPTEDETAKYLKGKEENMGKSTKMKGKRSRKDERKKHVINITKYLKFTPNNDLKSAFNHSQSSSSRKHFPTCIAYKKCNCANEEGNVLPSIWSGTRDKLLESVEVNSVSMKNKRTSYEISSESTKSNSVIDLTQNVDNEITQKTPERESRSHAHLNSCTLSSVKEKKPPSSRSKRNLSVTNYSSGDHNLTRLHSTPRSTPVQYLRRKLKMEDLCK